MADKKGKSVGVKRTLTKREQEEMKKKVSFCQQNVFDRVNKHSALEMVSADCGALHMTCRRKNRYQISGNILLISSLALV